MRAPRTRLPRLVLLLAAAAVATGPAARPARGQSAPPATALGTAMDLETAGSYARAAAAYRVALGGDDLVSAVLGLERVYAALGRTDSLIPVLDSLVGRHPGEPLLLSVRLRALLMSGQEARAHDMWQQWMSAGRGDPQPYREYARLLLDAGRVIAADSVLRLAQESLGSGRAVALELAQLRARIGLWGLSAVSWREALGDSPYLVQAAVFALQPAPAGARDSVRLALAAPPLEAASVQALARLELAWGDASAGWRALSALAPTDSVVDAWVAFADEAEALGGRAAAADALLAAARERPTAALRARAAQAALDLGRAGQALELAGPRPHGPAAAGSEPAGSDALLLPVRIRALAALGRPQEAESLVAEVARGQPALADGMQRELARAWVRAGNPTRAREALARAGADPDDELHGWLALYEGDLAGARTRLRAVGDSPDYLITAIALLGRTSADSAPTAGQAFLALARADTAGAAAAFLRAADALADAAPLLLATAARLYSAAGDEGEAGARAAWESIVTRFPDSPEAAEADLGWARALRRRGDSAGAARRLEHLILTFPRSALVPQARRELEQLGGAGSGAAAAPAPTPAPAAPPPQ